jgi:hypothetical protein
VLEVMAPGDTLHVTLVPLHEARQRRIGRENILGLGRRFGFCHSGIGPGETGGRAHCGRGGGKETAPAKIRIVLRIHVAASQAHAQPRWASHEQG